MFIINQQVVLLLISTHPVWLEVDILSPTVCYVIEGRCKCVRFYVLFAIEVQGFVPQKELLEGRVQHGICSPSNSLVVAAVVSAPATWRFLSLTQVLPETISNEPCPPKAMSFCHPHPGSQCRSGQCFCPRVSRGSGTTVHFSVCSCIWQMFPRCQLQG